MTARFPTKDGCRAHFVKRCAERGIPADPDRIATLVLAMAPCWRRRGGQRYKLRVRLGGTVTVFVVWDDVLQVPVTAWWPWNEPDDAPELEPPAGA